MMSVHFYVNTVCKQDSCCPLVAVAANVEQKPAAACLVGVHFSLPVVNKGPAHAVSAEGGGFRQAHLSAPVNGA